MKYTIKIECDSCDNTLTFEPKKTVVEFEGKVYEDYASIQEGIGENSSFSAKQTSEDLLYVTCKKCGREHELNL